MYWKSSEHFLRIFLLFFAIYFDSFQRTIGTYAAPTNSSEEIKSIFSIINNNGSVLKDIQKIGNYAEGGLINDNFILSTARAPIKYIATNVSFSKYGSTKSSLSEKQVVSSSLSALKKSNYSSNELSTNKSFFHTKLTDSESNLFLGVPEVNHTNGISSIKPRKGAHYSKIVARKGVESENEASETFSDGQPCFWLSDSECYDIKNMPNIKCSCCNESNILGKLIMQQVLPDCKVCKPVSVKSVEEGNCTNICCNSLVQNNNSVSSIQNISNANLNSQTVPSFKEKYQNTSNYYLEKSVTVKNIFKEHILEKEDMVSNIRKNSKHKPSITKVPYDVEIVTTLFSKSHQKVFAPVVVSLFLLPLIGLLLFFIWKRTKEYWNKRYYKRMDFLIDGMYND